LKGEGSPLYDVGFGTAADPDLQVVESTGQCLSFFCRPFRRILAFWRKRKLYLPGLIDISGCH